MSKKLKREIVMMAVQRRVLPLKDETAVQHAVRAYKIAQDCMAALEDKVEAEPAPAAPAEVSLATLDPNMVIFTKPSTWIWTKHPSVKWVTVDKQLKD
jgi:hypothetical protein